MQVSEGAWLTAERTLLEENHTIGLLVADIGTHVELADSIVQDTLPREGDGVGGLGVQVSRGASLISERLLLQRNHAMGLTAGHHDTSVVLLDTVIQDTRPQEVDNDFGAGIQVALGASLTAERVLLDSNRYLGLAAFDHGTIAVLTDLVVADTMEAACALDTCHGRGAGHGVAALANARVRISRFQILRSALAGVIIARDGEMDLSKGEIAENPIGANVQAGEFDTDRILRDDIRFRDNDLNLDSSEIPLPEPVDDVSLN